MPIGLEGMSGGSGESTADNTIDRSPGDITEFPLRRLAEPGTPAPEEDDYIAEIFEAPEDAATRRAAGAAAWARTDRASPCYSHLLTDRAENLSIEEDFELGKPELELLVQANRYQPRGKNDIIAFGLRGATLRGAHKLENVERIPLQDTRPDHRNFRCVVGFYFGSTGKFSAYTGSTVPWHGYMGTGVKYNLLPTGCYIYKKGTHRPQTQSRWVVPALRLSDADGAESGPATVLRTSRDLVFDLADEWDYCSPSDNIHCAYSDSAFSSLGCQTVRGGMHDGLWAEFQSTIKSLPDGARVDYVLITGAECSIAAGLVRAMKGPDDPEVLQRLGRLRTGSEGEEVKRLQSRLGVTATGYFGPVTKDKLTQFQRASNIPADGIFSPVIDARLAWGVFSIGPAEPAPTGEMASSPAAEPAMQPEPAQAPEPVAAPKPAESPAPAPAPAPVQPAAPEMPPPPAVALTADTLRAFAPRAKPEYVQILGEKGDDVLTRFGINENTKRFCHFMAQVGHECGGFTITEENLRYSAKRMVEVFGPGVHSAAITASEAQRLVGNPEAFAERVYGLGNPKKARDLGNTQPGDGYRYRGRGFLQITGRAAYREMGNKIGMDLEAGPDKAGEPVGALMTAAAFWDTRKLNTYADQDNIELITKRINGGHNGLADRKSQYAKAVSIWAGAGAAATRAPEGRGMGGQRRLEYGDLGADVLRMKEMLVRAGYGGFQMDEDFSRATHIAVVNFKLNNGLPGDGIVDAETWSALERAAGAAGAAKKGRARAEGWQMRSRGWAVWTCSLLLLLAAVSMIALRVAQPSAVQPFWSWIEVGFVGLVVITSLALMRLGSGVARSGRAAGLPQADEGVRPEVNTATAG